ncbi:MAG: HNH endonuclease [Paludibacter sp.]|nr:HNH endonuclease [Paludibacter sp.]
MIRVAKSAVVPHSLLVVGNTKYNHQDVQKQLIEDHKSKCYLCERTLVTDYEIEHLRPSAKNNQKLKTSWSNLFLSCGYCNKKKLHHFDNILNPSLHNIEEIILCNLATTKSVSFSSNMSGNFQVAETIALLTRIFNGTGKIRQIKEEQFYEYFLSRMNNFYSSLDKYISAKTPENKAIMIEELEIKQEFLAFKYHILKQRQDLFDEFTPYMVWNKV